MKEKILSSIFVTVRILASAWLTFLVSIIPLYIFRGTHPNDKIGENLIMSVIGIIFGFLFVMIFQARDDKSHRYSTKDAFFFGSGGVAFYIVLWLLVHLLTKNSYIVSVLGYNFSCLMGIGANERPTFFASLISALIFGVVYFLAIIAGTKIAHKRQNKFLKTIHKDNL